MKMITDPGMNMENLEQVWTCYNTLPTLLDATSRFANRDRVFSSLAKLLSQHGNIFGVCLVHAHCTLSESEIMLEEDDISQPVSVSHLKNYYPKCWLPSGEPYEFTTFPTQAPPDALVEEFRAVTEAIEVLGLYYTGVEETDEIKLEWTEGRMNKVRKMKEEDWYEGPVETAWNLGKGDPVTMACRLLCATATTDQGGYHLSEYLILDQPKIASNLFAEKKVHREIT